MDSSPGPASFNYRVFIGPGVKSQHGGRIVDGRGLTGQKLVGNDLIPSVLQAQAGVRIGLSYDPGGNSLLLNSVWIAQLVATF